MINPPTDNLYKFCAIFGLILIVFNSYYNFEMLEKTKQDLIISNGDDKKISFEIELNKDKTVKLKEKFELLIKTEKNTINKQYTLISVYRNASQKHLEQLKIEIDQGNKSSKEIAKEIDSLNRNIEIESNSLVFKTIEHDTKAKLIVSEVKKCNMYFKYLIAGIILGFFLTIYGFKNWIKIQKKIDENLFNNQ